MSLGDFCWSNCRVSPFFLKLTTGVARVQTSMGKQVLAWYLFRKLRCGLATYNLPYCKKTGCLWSVEFRGFNTSGCFGSKWGATWTGLLADSLTIVLNFKKVSHVLETATACIILSGNLYTCVEKGLRDAELLLNRGPLRQISFFVFLRRKPRRLGMSRLWDRLRSNNDCSFISASTIPLVTVFMPLGRKALLELSSSSTETHLNDCEKRFSVPAQFRTGDLSRVRRTW